MKIIVCVKEAPGRSETGASILNSEDSNAIEAALKIKDEIPGTNVTALTAGATHAVGILQDCLSMGADEAISVCDDSISDLGMWASAMAFAAAIKKIGKFDLIIASRQLVESNVINMASIISEKLDIPQFSYVCGLDTDTNTDDTVRIKSRISDGYDEFEVKLPCFLAVTKELNDPRFMTCAGAINALNANIEVWDLKVLGVSGPSLEAAEAHSKPIFTFEPRKRKQRIELKNDDPQKVADELMDNLKNRYAV